VRFDGTFADEGVYADAAARHIGVEHHEVRVPRDELPQLVADMAWHLDEPMAFMATAEILAVSRYARRHVEVLLTGETADELFGGYTRMRLLRYPRLVAATGRVLRPFRGRLRHGSRWYRAASSAMVSPAEWIAASYADGDPTRFSAAPLGEWAPFRAQAAEQAVQEHRDPVIQALAYERLTHLPPILMTGDRMTMGAGIEARLPFTDPRLLDLAGRATKAQLFSGPHGKQPLRDAMIGVLPELTLNRRKRGWTSPYAIYLREIPALRSWLATVPDHAIVATSPLGRQRARTAVDNFLGGADQSYQMAWALGRIVLWHQVCVEGVRNPFEVAAQGRA
jgi:asparagine synthase (glutamine-hydrolysing)